MKKKSIISVLSLVLASVIVLFSFPVTAGASDVITDLEIEPITIIEGTNGLTDYNENYFEYTFEDKLNYTVTFADGEVVTGTGYMFEHNGVHYNFETETDQSKTNPWVAGNTYTAIVSLMDKSVEVPVTIEETPVESIYVEAMSFDEYTFGHWETSCNNDSGKIEKDFYRYDYEDQIKGIVTFKDGTTVNLSNTIEYNGEDYWYSITDDQSLNNEWKAGSSYTAQIEFMNVKADMYVYINDSHIESVEVEPVKITENTSGQWAERRENLYFSYELYNCLNYTITLDDGEVITGTGDHVFVGDKAYTINITTDQSYLDPWTVGNTYEFEVELAGCISYTTAEIIPTNVESVEIEPVEIYENTMGNIITVEDEEEVTIDEYFLYNPNNSIHYTVTYKNGDVVTGMGSSDDVDVSVFTNQSYHNQWTTGNTYEMIVSVDGFVTTADVSILECPIESIDVKPITIVEGSYCSVYSDYDDETGESHNEYMHYFPDELLEYTITFTDGTVIIGTDYTFEYNGAEYSFFASTDQSYENQWTAGNTYTYTLKAMGFEAQGEVTIEKAQKGDTNLDGDIDIADATYIQLYLAQYEELSDFAIQLADVNNDSNLSILDVTEIQRYLAGYVTEF